MFRHMPCVYSILRLQTLILCSYVCACVDAWQDLFAIVTHSIKKDIEIAPPITMSAVLSIFVVCIVHKSSVSSSVFGCLVLKFELFWLRIVPCYLCQTTFRSRLTNRLWWCQYVTWGTLWVRIKTVMYYHKSSNFSFFPTASLWYNCK